LVLVRIIDLFDLNTGICDDLYTRYRLPIIAATTTTQAMSEPHYEGRRLGVKKEETEDEGA
jgi:hypothetical protein